MYVSSSAVIRKKCFCEGRSCLFKLKVTSLDGKVAVSEPELFVDIQDLFR